MKNTLSLALSHQGRGNRLKFLRRGKINLELVSLRKI
jgi:hypothetical protein